MIKVINIDYDLGNENIENIKEDILIRNDLKDEADKFDIVYKYLNEDNKIWTIIVEVSSYSYAKIMDTKKLYVGTNRCPVFDDFNLNICYKCSKYGHSSKKCRNNEICGYCAQNHSSKNCQQKDDTKCSNCIDFNNRYNQNRPINHAAGNRNICPSYKALLGKCIAKTDYPYNPLNNTSTIISKKATNIARNNNGS